MSLAEEFAADLESDGSDEEMDVKEECDEDAPMDDAEAATEDGTKQEHLAKYDRVGDIAKLTQKEEYKQLIEEMHEQLNASEAPTFTSPLESDPQYKLIVKLSQLAAEIDLEIGVIHKFVHDKYEKRFPELDSLIPVPQQYINAVRLLGNDINTKGQNKELLSQVIPPATCIVVSVTASTTQGTKLEEEELEAVMEACQMASDLQMERANMNTLVERRMELIAPNLCAILGAQVAATLVSKAGGLAPLSRLPACNVLVLGAQKRTLQGFSMTNAMPHCGLIFYHQIVQSLPPDLRRKGARLVAAKCTLAARVDSLHESADGHIGQKLADEIDKKIEKMLEPPPVKNLKALPKPLDKASKKRGGRRVRKEKERLGLTELRKKANRMNFGELQEDVMQDNMGFTLGQASGGGAGSGSIRAAAIDNKTRVRMSQKLQKRLEQQRQMSGGATSIRSKVSGTASSVTFTPVQGLEIINPNINAQDSRSSSSTYFSATSGFVKVQTPLPPGGNYRA
uniref:U4/U6 small nuclear ribonucleoprotein Prp31 n=1 Tax=Steinernema glaseri TaxID=37863 RepID=A0A1I7YNS0_9BILA